MAVAPVSISPDELTVAYQPLARGIAAKYAHILPLEDLEGEAIIALLKAAQAWDGVYPFPACARRRINFHLLDYIRSRLGKHNQRYAIDTAQSIDAMADAIEGDVDELEFVGSDYILEDEIVRNAIVATLRCALLRLPPRERDVIELYYIHGLKIWQVGERLAISDINASQVHMKALRRLKVAMTELGVRHLPSELMV